MVNPGWIMLGLGVLIAAVGVFWLFGLSVPWLGKLPGDIAIERNNFRFYFPLATCLLLSLLATGLIWLVKLFSR